jgi:hypothetical protein
MELSFSFSRWLMFAAIGTALKRSVWVSELTVVEWHLLSDVNLQT